MLKKVDQKTVLTDDNKTVENIQDAITNIKKNQNMEDSIKTILNLPMGIKCLDNYDQLDPKIKNAINIYLQEAGRIEGVFSTEDKVNHNDPSKTTISLSEPLLSNTLKLGVVKRNFVKLALLLQGITLSYNEKEISFAGTLFDKLACNDQLNEGYKYQQDKNISAKTFYQQWIIKYCFDNKEDSMPTYEEVLGNFKEAMTQELLEYDFENDEATTKFMKKAYFTAYAQRAFDQGISCQVATQRFQKDAKGIFKEAETKAEFENTYNALAEDFIGFCKRKGVELPAEYQAEYQEGNPDKKQQDLFLAPMLLQKDRSLLTEKYKNTAERIGERHPTFKHLYEAKAKAQADETAAAEARAVTKIQAVWRAWEAAKENFHDPINHAAEAAAAVEAAAHVKNSPETKVDLAMRAAAGADETAGAKKNTVPTIQQAIQKTIGSLSLTLEKQIEIMRNCKNLKSFKAADEAKGRTHDFINNLRQNFTKSEFDKIYSSDFLNSTLYTEMQKAVVTRIVDNRLAESTLFKNQEVRITEAKDIKTKANNISTDNLEKFVKWITKWTGTYNKLGLRDLKEKIMEYKDPPNIDSTETEQADSSDNTVPRQEKLASLKLASLGNSLKIRKTRAKQYIPKAKAFLRKKNRYDNSPPEQPKNEP